MTAHILQYLTLILLLACLIVLASEVHTLWAELLTCEAGKP